MADENKFVDAERLGQGVAIGAQALESQLVKIGWTLRFPLPQLVVADDLGVVGKRIDERAEILMIQAQAAVQEDDRNSFSQAHVVEVFPVHGNEPRSLGLGGRRRICGPY